MVYYYLFGLSCFLQFKGYVVRGQNNPINPRWSPTNPHFVFPGLKTTDETH